MNCRMFSSFVIKLREMFKYLILDAMPGENSSIVFILKFEAYIVYLFSEIL